MAVDCYIYAENNLLKHVLLLRLLNYAYRSGFERLDVKDVLIHKPSCFPISNKDFT